MQNLTHRDSDEFPEPLEPGRRYAVTVKLDAVGHAFAPGNRLRVGISPTYWPWAWPSPEPVTLTIHPEASALRLPLRTPSPDDQRLAPFGPPQESPRMVTEQLHGGPAGRSMSLDLSTGRTELAFDWDVGGLVRMPTGIEVEDTNRTVYSIVEGDPLSAEVRCLMTGSYGRGDWRTHCETDSRMTCDAERFTVTNTLRAWEGDERVFERTWTSVLPRDLV
jgi:hypothetical protein